MTARTSARLAWSLLVIGMLMLAVTLVLGIGRGHQGEGVTFFLDDVAWLLSLATFVPVGALIAARRPENPVGWLILAIGLCEIVSKFAYEYAAYGLVLHPGSLPGALAMAWLSVIVWAPELALLPFVFVLFPNGRLLSRGWAVVGWIPVAWLVGWFALGVAVWPYRGTRFLRDTDSFLVPHLEGIEDILFSAFPFVLLCLVAALIGLVVRFRRARGIERQQLKWAAFVAALAAVSLFVTEFVLTPLGFENATYTLLTDVIIGPGTFAVAAAIAILRYQLYDIDLVINRTLVYGALTALLVAVYAGGVVVLGELVRTLFGQANNSLAVAASTLGVAALFRPARGAIQSFIDRRFYRAKYDATQTLDLFSARLRDEVDLETLAVDLVGVVQETMQPAHVAIWLRDGRSTIGAGTGGSARRAGEVTP